MDQFDYNMFSNRLSRIEDQLERIADALEILTLEKSRRFVLDTHCRLYDKYNEIETKYAENIMNCPKYKGEEE